VTHIAVIADTHLPRGARRLPAECVRRLEAADLILHAGDLVGASFLAELRSLGPPVTAVHGNADDAEVRQLLPARRVVEVDGVAIGVTHEPGPRAGRSERLVEAFPGCAAVVYGHTHQPAVKRYEDVWLLNPGSPTERRRAPARTMLKLEVVDGRIAPTLVELSA
jgi:putative phosphoesterase